MASIASCSELTLGTLNTTAGPFTFHLYPGGGPTTLVFIPGVLESRAGLCYMGHELAAYFHERNVSVLLFDLAGQGDATLPFSLALWIEQIEAISLFLKDKQIVFVGRGLGAYLPFTASASLPVACKMIALSPPDLDTLVLGGHWPPMQASPLTTGCITPLDPHHLSQKDQDFWYSLGSEVECLGSLEVPVDFFTQLLDFSFLVKKTGGHFDITYDASKGLFPAGFPLSECHPLFNKHVERQALYADVGRHVF